MSSNLSELTALLATEIADGDLLYVFDVSASGVARSKKMTRKEARRAFAARGYNATTNSSGNTTVTPESFIGEHTEEITVSGVARTSVIILTAGDGTTRYAGERLALSLRLQATSAIVLEVRDNAVDGTLLFSLTTDGTGDDALLEFVHNGTAWKPLRATYPTLTGL